MVEVFQLLLVPFLCVPVRLLDSPEGHCRDDLSISATMGSVAAVFCCSMISHRSILALRVSLSYTPQSVCQYFGFAAMSASWRTTSSNTNMHSHAVTVCGPECKKIGGLTCCKNDCIKGPDLRGHFRHYSLLQSQTVLVVIFKQSPSMACFSEGGRNLSRNLFQVIKTCSATHFMQQQTEIVTLPLSRTDSVNPANCWGFKDALLVCHSVSLFVVAPNLCKSEARL